MKQPKSHPAAGNRVATRGGSYSLAVTALVLAILAVRLVTRRRMPKWGNCLLWGLVAE